MVASALGHTPAAGCTRATMAAAHTVMLSAAQMASTAVPPTPSVISPQVDVGWVTLDVTSSSPIVCVLHLFFPLFMFCTVCVAFLSRWGWHWALVILCPFRDVWYTATYHSLNFVFQNTITNTTTLESARLTVSRRPTQRLTEFPIWSRGGPVRGTYKYWTLNQFKLLSHIMF